MAACNYADTEAVLIDYDNLASINKIPGRVLFKPGSFINMEYIKLTGDENALVYLMKTGSVFDKKKPAWIKYVDHEEKKLKKEIIGLKNNIDSVKVKRYKKSAQSL